MVYFNLWNFEMGVGLDLMKSARFGNFNDWKVGAFESLFCPLFPMIYMKTKKMNTKSVEKLGSSA